MSWPYSHNPPWPPHPTHAAIWTAWQNFRFTAPARQTLTGKWCDHCAKDTHNDADCWSTRAVPSVT